MINVFFETYVQNRPEGGSTIFWGLRREFSDPGPYHFQVFWAEAPTGNFELVNTGELIDVYYAVDPLPRVFAKELESFYKVVLTTSKGTYESVPFQAYGTWTKRDWLHARDIIRRENLVARKFTARRGMLFKIKVWGEACPRCADKDTHEAAQSHCPVCYGTGKTGGYWPPIEIFTIETEEAQQGHIKSNMDAEPGGLVDNTLFIGRTIAYPHLATYDFFWDESTGRRYILRHIANVALIKGIPLVCNVEYNLAEFSNAVYLVPLNPSPYAPPCPTPPDAVPSDDFLLSPSTGEPEPVEVVTPAPEPTPPVPPVETHIDSGNPAIWFDGKQWNIGHILGDTASSLYRTTNATSNPYFIPTYNWSPYPITFDISGDGFIVSDAVSTINGVYTKAGTYNNMFAYLKV